MRIGVVVNVTAIYLLHLFFNNLQLSFSFTFMPQPNMSVDLALTSEAAEAQLAGKSTDPRRSQGLGAKLAAAVKTLVIQA